MVPMLRGRQAMGSAMMILPCPFCGYTAWMIPPTCNKQTPYDPADRAFPIVRCWKCNAEACGTDWDESGKSAIEKWNTRVEVADKAGARVDGFDYKAAYVRKVESISAIAELLGMDDSDGSDDAVVQAVKAMLEAAPQPGEVVGEAVVNDFWNRIGQSHPNKKLVRDALEWFVSRAPVSPSIQPTYYVKHPDGSYSEGPSSNLVYMTRSELAAIDETIQSFANDTAKPDAARDADAARYRFIRDLGWFEAKYGEFEYSNDVMSERLSKDLDACIDAAMAAGRGEVG
jgi:hypothetical protein